MSAILNQAPSLARLEQICGLAVLFGVGLIAGFALMLAAVHVVLVVRERHLARRRRIEFRARLRAERSAAAGEALWAEGVDWEVAPSQFLTNHTNHTNHPSHKVGPVLLEQPGPMTTPDGGRNVNR